MSAFLGVFWDCMKGWIVVLSLIGGFFGGILLAGGVGAWIINAGGGWFAIPAALLTFLVSVTLGSMPWRITTS